MVTLGTSAGNTINPITDARLMISMSSNTLAKRLGFSRQYISKAEQGTYTSLNPALVLWIANISQTTKETVNQKYVNFQKAQRNATVEKIDPEPLVRPAGNFQPGYVLFQKWREGYWNSSVAFGVAFCLHPETIDTYEDGQRKKMPYPLREVLDEFRLIEHNWSDNPKVKPFVEVSTN